MGYLTLWTRMAWDMTSLHTMWLGWMCKGTQGLVGAFWAMGKLMALQVKLATFFYIFFHIGMQEYWMEIGPIYLQ